MLNIPKAFTQGASKALMQAQISAASMGHERVGTGHILIGLCRGTDELTAMMLGDVSVSQVERAVFERYGRGEVGFSRVTGFTPHAQRVLMRAVAYANPEKKTLAGVAHIWQELLYEEDSTALRVLLALGRSVDVMRAALRDGVGEIERPLGARTIRASAEPVSRREVERAQNAQMNRSQDEEEDEDKSALDTYARDLTGAAAARELEPVIGRAQELRAMIRVLGKKTKNNPLLVGEPGVGKSALAEALAQRIADGDVPDSLKHMRLYALDLALLVAGTKFRGEFEERVKRIVEEAQDRGNVILFIDEMHTLVGAGGSEGSLDAANLLKPALARGQVRVIGATTYKEFRKYVEKDAALARRFQKIDVAEPDPEQTLQILGGLRERYEDYHHVTIADDALLSAVELSSRYVTDRFMPDKAIDLIDEAASMARQECTSGAIPLPPASPELPETQAESLSPEREELAVCEDGKAVAQRMPGVVVHAPEIARVVAQWTGIPLEQMNGDEQKRVLHLEEQLSRRVIGQSEAVSTLARAIRRARAGLNDPGRPLGVFMLLGPSGVGKTELCKALSEALFGSEDALIRIDMSEYSEEYTASRLIGSAPGYVGYGDGGQLTDAVLKRPYSVVLFDEIEKAHPKIFNLLLQLLDDGQLTDSVGRKVNFKNTVIVMTSNAGVSFDMDKRLGFAVDSHAALDDARRRTIMEKAKMTFRPEFLGRIDEMVVMNSLTEEDGKRIAELMLGQVVQRLAKLGVLLEYDEDVPALLAKEGVDKASGARNLRRVIRTRVEDPLSDRLLMGGAAGGLRLRARGAEVTVEERESALEPAECRA